MVCRSAVRQLPSHLQLQNFAALHILTLLWLSSITTFHQEVWMTKRRIMPRRHQAIGTNKIKWKWVFSDSCVYSIRPSFLYGVRSGVNNGGIHFTGGHTLLYPAGKKILLSDWSTVCNTVFWLVAGAGVALVNVQNSHQEIVALTGKGSHISALALNPTRNLIKLSIK